MRIQIEMVLAAVLGRVLQELPLPDRATVIREHLAAVAVRTYRIITDNRAAPSCHPAEAVSRSRLETLAHKAHLAVAEVKMPEEILAGACHRQEALSVTEPTPGAASEDIDKQK